MSATNISATGRAALAYAERFGFAVLPLHTPNPDGTCDCRGRVEDCSIGKHPRTLNGFKAASKDPKQIAEWWSMWPAANVGIATGAPSGIFVLDIDTKNGVDGYGTLDALTSAHGVFTTTPMVITGSMGAHYYFKHPGSIGSRAGIVGPGIDHRGDDGYVVAPPSLHTSGRKYEWEMSSRIGDVPLAEVPAWLVEKLRGPSGQSGARQGHSPSEWAELAAGAGKGTRNNTLASVAGILFRYLPAPLAFECGTSWAHEHLDPPLSDDEIARTLNSIAGKELARRTSEISPHG